MTCICGKGESLETCCGPLLDGTAKPSSAEALMRSRYVAYVTGKIDYILATHHPERRQEVDRASTERWSQSAKWRGLQIVSTEEGGPEDTTGKVEFIASYSIKNMAVKHHELATFEKVDGVWYFADGQEVSTQPIVNEGPKLGRNDPCHCGSGKKYKKCHGAAA